MLQPVIIDVEKIVRSVFDSEFILGAVVSLTVIVLYQNIQKRFRIEADKREDTATRVKNIENQLEKLNDNIKDLIRINETLHDIKMLLNTLQSESIAIKGLIESLKSYSNDKHSLTQSSISSLESSLKQIETKLVELSIKVDNMEAFIIDKLNKIGESYDLQ